MEITVFLVALAAGVLAGSAVAGRLGVPAPLLLIAAGIVVSLVPGVPEVFLPPEVVLLGLLPPLLYAAALDTSLVDFAAQRRPILLLSVGLVAFTVVGVAAVVHLVLPGISWAAAFAIGAVVAPPDAVAATAIARRIGLPRRIVTILEGESLLNDATALVALRVSVAALGGGVTALDVGLGFLLAAGGGTAVGVAAYVGVGWMRKHTSDPVLDSSISLVVPFVAYVAAEEVEASGVIAVVVAGLLLGHRAPVLQTAQSRIADRMNWRTVAFLLENAVFLLIGLQGRWILEDVAGSTVPGWRIALVCVATLVSVVALRLVWVFPARYLLVRKRQFVDEGRGPGPWSHTLVLGWAGMRGVVTLAAAFVIPDTTDYREILLLAAFTTVAGTLFLQGLTLPWLARTLRVPSPDPREDALARATLLQQASKAGMAELDRLEVTDDHGVLDVIRQRVDQRNFAAWERLTTTAGSEAPSDLYNRARLAMIAAERRRVLEIRSTGHVAAEVVADVLAMLDVEESMLDVAQREREELHDVTRQTARSGEACVHLARWSSTGHVEATECATCVAEGLVSVALRQCLECGHVGCCDSSVGQHASRHWEETGHPVMQSAEAEEDWRWCYEDHLTG